MFVKSILAFSAVLLLAATSFAHLPTSYDASLRYGRTGFNARSQLDRARSVVYRNKGEWSADSSYLGDFAIGQGDTVSHGTWPANDPNGRKLWWWAKFAASGADRPGTAKEGGTSAWVLVNSLSATETGNPNYRWRGWNGDIANHNAAAP